MGEDVKKQDLDEVLGTIGKTAEEQLPFELAVEGVGVFPDVIYGKVGAGSLNVRRLNTKLVERLGDLAVRSQFDGRKMIPHVTIAHFATTDVEPLLAKVAKLATRFMGSMTVSSIDVRGWYPHGFSGEEEVPVSKPIVSFRLCGNKRTGV